MSLLTINVTPEQQELLTNLIIEERRALRASREYCLDDEVIENDERYDALGVLFEEVTDHSAEPGDGEEGFEDWGSIGPPS